MSFASALVASPDPLLQQTLSDVPFVALGLLAFALLTFVVSMGRLDRRISLITLASLCAFVASILDLSRVLSTPLSVVQAANGTASVTSLYSITFLDPAVAIFGQQPAAPRTSGNIALLIAIEVLLAIGVAAKYAFLLVHASQSPRIEVIESIREAERRLVRAFANRADSKAEREKQGRGDAGPIGTFGGPRHGRQSLLSLLSQEGQGLYGKNGMSSAAWENWGSFGLLVFGLLWIGVATILVLEAVWRVGLVFRPDRAVGVYRASWITQLVFRAVIIVKIVSIISLTLVRPRINVAKDYVQAFLGIALGAGVAVASLVIVGFSECLIGRFLLALEMYTYSVLVLIATFFVERRWTEEDDKRRSGRVDSTFSMLVVPPSAPFRVSVPFMSAADQRESMNRTAPEANLATIAAATRPELRRAPSTQSSSAVRGWLASKKASLRSSTTPDKRSGSWTVLPDTGFGLTGSQEKLEDLIFDMLSPSTAGNMAASGPSSEKPRQNYAAATAESPLLRPEVSAIINKDLASQAALGDTLRSIDSAKYDRPSHSRQSSFPVYDGRGNRLDSPKEAVLGNLGMPEEQLSQPAAGPSRLMPNKIPGALARSSHLSQVESVSASSFSLGPVSPSAFPQPPEAMPGVPTGQNPNSRRSDGTLGSRISQNDLFFLPPSMPYAKAPNKTGLAITSFIEDGRLSSSSTARQLPRLSAFGQVGPAVPEEEMPPPALRAGRDGSNDNDSDTGTIRELQEAQVSMAYIQRMSLRSGASTMSQYPDNPVIAAPAALPRPPPPAASSFITWGSPNGSAERRPGAPTYVRNPNSSRLPISNPMVMQQVNASRPLYPTRFVGGSPLSGATQYSRYERPRPAPLVFGDKADRGA